jgi:hypothetical protein
MDFTSLYCTQIQKTFDDDLASILQIFQDKCTDKEHAKVSLTNYYKGLPIIYPATVLGVERGNLDLDVSPQQAVAIASDHYTLIRSKLFPHPIVGHAQYVNVKKHIVSLNKLCFVELLAEKRSAVRLVLEPPMDAMVSCAGYELLGHIVDISIHGAAMLVDDYTELPADAELSLDFKLLDPVQHTQTIVKVPATLVNIDGDASPYRYKFRISPDKQLEQLISRYSFHRQVEIIRSLKDVVD